MFTRSMVDKLYVPLGKSYNIQCRRGMLKNNRFAEIINEDNLSALSNYAKHKNANLFIDDLENDMFHDVKVYVYKNGTSDKKAFPFKFDNAKEDFTNCMRNLYKKVEKAIVDLKTDSIK